jgi:protease I
MSLFDSQQDRKTGPLAGKRIAILATQGVEEVELTGPRKALEDAGATVDLISPEEHIKWGEIRAWDAADWGRKFQVDVKLSRAEASSYDALHLPGGVMNPDFLRQNPVAVAFVKQFFTAGKPVSAICHASWTLIEAGVVRGRVMTSWPSLHTDLHNAGAHWVDREVVVDGNLTTSRKPGDLPAFNEAIVQQFCRTNNAAVPSAMRFGWHMAEPAVA